MPARNDPVLDSGFPQVDIPRRRRRPLRSSLVWWLPLLAGAIILIGSGDLDDLDTRLRVAGGLIFGSVVLQAVWAWRTRWLDCPRCGQRIARVGTDTECAYYPCRSCRVMWRSTAERMPTVDADDLY
jgi:hypothetical protein